MTDTTSMTILPAAMSTDPNAATLVQATANSLPGGTNQQKSLHEGSFLDFLKAFNTLPTIENSLQNNVTEGGITLPPVAETANLDRLPTGLTPFAPSNWQIATDNSVDTAAVPTAFNLKPAGDNSEAALAARLAGVMPVIPHTQQSAIAANVSSNVSMAADVSKALSGAVPNVTNDEALTQLTTVANSAQKTSETLTTAVTAPMVLSERQQTQPTKSNVISSAQTDAVSRNGQSFDINLNPSSTNPALSESDTLFAAQVKKMFIDQQGGLNSERLPTQNTTFSTLSPSTASHVTATPINFANTASAITTETATPATHQATISEPFGKSEWNQGLARQMLIMAGQNVRSAELRLNPSNLGPIEVRIDIDDEQVNLAFTSRNAGVREAVELALPKLREMFEESGLNLADTDVSQQSFAEQRSQEASDQQNQPYNDMANQTESDNDSNSASLDETRHVNLNMVDYFA